MYEGSFMKSFNVGHVDVRVIDGTKDFVGVPERGAAEKTGTAQLAHLSTPDGLDMTIGVITWPEREIVDVRVVDFENGMFNNFTPYTVSTYPGFALENIEDAIKFIVSHDALHYGCSLMMKKLVVA
jgi:hypothetical protein